jgi:hypothetical protein
LKLAELESANKELDSAKAKEKELKKAKKELEQMKAMEEVIKYFRNLTFKSRYDIKIDIQRLNRSDKEYILKMLMNDSARKYTKSQVLTALGITSQDTKYDKKKYRKTWEDIKKKYSTDKKRDAFFVKKYWEFFLDLITKKAPPKHN